MSNLSKLEFVALDISEKNYLSWVLDAKIHLTAKGLGDCIIEGNKASSQNKAKAMIFLRHHLDESLKVEYLTVKDPLELWIGLKGRIISQLKLCGKVIKDEDMLEKTLTTFHASNMILQQQYREKGLKKYSELISCLLVAEQHNDLLMKNHEARPTGSAPLPEAHGVEAHDQSEIRQNNRDHDNVRGLGKGKRRYNNRRGGGHNKREKNMGSQNNPSKGKGDHCYRCGLKGHWKNECRAPEHFVRLYQNSFKRKGNRGGASSSNARVESYLTLKNDVQAGSSQKYDENVKANLALKDDAFDGLDDITHLEAEDFFRDRN
ncbi:uncharacterized protein LOC125858808 [Solanum stenotomum]|uniref:uncharacterized protein LOC125858808 n=1 Tax=Solanum stenotomum TaxID=172797 RepID=UPI0020D0EB51|nr:uncharacterized protein LOC125858808 [Solanum stenotomum]